MSTQNLSTIICTNLEEFEQHIENLFVVRIPDGVTHIPDGAFKNGHLIKEVILPASLESLGDEAFMNCDKLETVTFLGNNLTDIGKFAFSDCTSLQHIDIPNGVTSIGQSAFHGCISLETVDFLGNNVTSIGSFAFFGCISLEHIDIPNGVTSIGQSAFQSCTSLETVDFLGNNVTSIGSCAFFMCTSLQQIAIPDGVTEIGDCAFFTSLHVPTLGDHVTVGRYAFKECIRPDIFAASSKPPLKMQHDDICSICHESDWNNAVLLNCGHIFHKTCAQTWFTRKANCVNCRAPTTSCNHIIVVKPTHKRERITTTSSSNKRVRR